MKIYMNIGDQKIELTEDQANALRIALQCDRVKLSDVKEGDLFKLGTREFFVLEQSGDTTAVILKDLLHNGMAFGKNNRYCGSDVDKACEEFADEITSIVGEKNLLEHTVDLTSDDGLKDYGKIWRRVSLLTADQYRRYVDVLDKFKLDRWWWLATPFSTTRHKDDCLVKCVSPSGRIYIVNCNYDNFGVRPFCILKSNIFVSK